MMNFFRRLPSGLDINFRSVPPANFSKMYAARPAGESLIPMPAIRKIRFIVLIYLQWRDMAWHENIILEDKRWQWHQIDKTKQ